MNEREQGPVPLIEGVWPPPPLRDDPPPLFLRVEGMQITRSGDRLIVLNTSIRGLFLVEICCLLFPLLSPWISFWRNPFHHAALLPYVISAYRVTYGLYLFLFCLLAGIWCWFTFQFNLGGVTLDRGDQSVKAGGRPERPMSRIKAVEIKPMPNTFLGRQYVVSLLWSSDEPMPCRSFLGASRQEANAEKAAAMIAEFAKIPVQQEPGEKPVSL